MNKQTFIFYGNGGIIPGIPGSFSAGIVVDVDLDTMTILAERSLNLPPHETFPTLAPVTDEVVDEEASHTPDEGR
jgi:hypothetical protein